MNEAQAAHDEITVFDIVAKLWRRRGLIIIMTLIALGLGLIAVAFTMLRTQNPVVYYVALRSITNGEYPNGTSFSPQDLLIPQVLNRLRERFKLSPDSDLRTAITVNFDSPTAQGAELKYRTRLATKNLSQTEIDSINKSYEEELRASVRSSLRIEVNYGELGVEKPVGVAIANALPEIWNEVYVSQFRILANTALQGAAVTYGDEPLDGTSSILVAHKRLGSLTRGLGIVANDNRLASVLTDDGYSAPDLQEQLQRFRTIYFNPIFASGFSEDNAVAITYLRELNLEIDNLKRYSSGIDQTLTDLRDYQRSGRPVAGAQPAGQIGTPDAVQLGESALGEIVSLATQASLAKYLQETLERREGISGRISELQKELELARSTIAQATTPGFRSEAATELSQLTKRYQNLLAKARDRATQRSGELYTPMASPIVVGSLLPRYSLIMLILSIMVGGLVAVVTALLLPARERPQVATAERTGPIRPSRAA